MQDRKSQKNFERALLHEMEKIKIAARQWHSNNTKGYRDSRSKEAISKSFSEIAVLCMSWNVRGGCHAYYSPIFKNYEEIRES